MAIKYTTLENLSYFLDKNKEIFSGKNHKHTTSDISELDSILADKIEKNTYSGISEFPSIGTVGEIYIDISANKTYRWDDEKLLYFCIGSDYNEIEIINGGGS